MISHSLSLFLLFLPLLILGDNDIEYKDSTVPIEEDPLGYHFVVLQPGKGLKVSCARLEGGIVWRFPENKDLSGYDENDVKKRISEGEDASDPRVRILQITKAKTTDSGFYTCYERGNEENKFEFYVYVKGDDPFLKPSKAGFVVDTPGFTVPCRSSTHVPPDSVFLYIEGVKLEQATSRYDPRIGFKLYAHDLQGTSIHQKSFKCENVNGGRSVEFYIEKEKPTNYSTAVLQIKQQNEWPFVDASNFLISCSVMDRPKLSFIYKHRLEFECPRCGDKDAVIRISKSLGGEKGLLAQLNITKLTKEDEGIYTCIWSIEENNVWVKRNSTSHKLTISPFEGQVRFESRSPEGVVVVNEGEDVNLSALVSAYPFDLPNYHSKWMRKYTRPGSAENESETIVNDDSRVIESRKESGGKATEELKIRGIHTNDSGSYFLITEVMGRMNLTEWKVEVNKEKFVPQIKVISTTSWVVFDQQFYKIGTNIRVQCLVTGLPLASPKLYTRGKNARAWIDVPSNEVEKLTGTFEQGLIWNTTVEGDADVKCEGKRGMKTEIDVMKIRVADGKPNVTTEIVKHPESTGTEDKGLIYDGDDVILKCTIPMDDRMSPKWLFRDVELTDNVHNQTEQHSHVLYAELKNITSSKSGEYVCLVSKDGQSEPYKQIITVTKTTKPSLSDGISSVPLTLKYGESADMECPMEGTPKPEIVWLRGDTVLLRQTSHPTVHHFDRIVAEDRGEYICRGTNRAGITEKRITVEVTGVPQHFSTGAIVMLALVACIVLIILCVISYSWFNQRKKGLEQERALKALYEQLMNAEVIQTPLADPGTKLTLDQRVQQIPYDRQFEVERTNLEVGRMLGQGNFGKVTMGWLSKPRRVSDSTVERVRLPVAVKMPLNGRNVTQQTMLAHELKIMSAIPPHPNVLSLVGAVTKNMTGGELFVVVEMCDNGNLKDFLIQYKKKPGAFIDELRPPPAPADGYLAPTSGAKSIYASQENEEWANDMESDRLLSSSSHLASSDLISFAMQIANGMEYLSSVPCIHRDLAARNVLVTKDRLCRIADFGLAKQEPKHYYRTKKSKDLPMPMRWMSPESIQHNFYTQSSDVWSFGILLYEIFTLGGTPYPQYGNDVIMGKIIAGERNTKPKYAHEDIYELMQKCCEEESTERPTFKECLGMLRGHLKMASPQLLERVETLLRSEFDKIMSYSDWRGEDQLDNGEEVVLLPKKPTNILIDRPSPSNSHHYTQNFPMQRGN